MTHRTISTVATAIAIVALAAPAALARPADQPVKATVEQAKQDGVARDTNVGAYTPGAIPALSYRSGGTSAPEAIRSHPHASNGHPYATSGYPTARVQGDPRLAIKHEAPADSGIAWSLIGVGIASLLVIAAIAGLASRARRSGRPRVAV